MSDPTSELIEIPFGESVAISAGPDDPKWIRPAAGDLHMTLSQSVGHDSANGPLFAAHPPVLITRPTSVYEPNGHASRLLVFNERPRGARHHDQKAAA